MNTRQIVSCQFVRMGFFEIGRIYFSFFRLTKMRSGSLCDLKYQMYLGHSSSRTTADHRIS